MAKQLQWHKPAKLIDGYRLKERAESTTSSPLFSEEELRARSDTVTEVLKRIMRFPLHGPK
jgi:hypothetical protein